MSTFAGAVGTAVGQIARRLGAARVIGSAGSTEKTAALTHKYGYDVALNYKEAPIREQLVRAVGEDRVGVFFDNLGNVLTCRLRMQGFIVTEVAAAHPGAVEEFRERMTGWLSSGQVICEETVMDGFDSILEAFLAMMRGDNRGKMIVRLG